MVGKDFWEELEIDAVHYENELRSIAEDLIDDWGEDISEADLLRLNALSKALDSRVENVIAAYALEYYMTHDHKPQFIHQYRNSPVKQPWWKFWKKITHAYTGNQ